MDPIRRLQQRLSVNFKHPDLLRLAMTHSSYVAEHPEAGPSNERLEFLGDAVLGHAVSQRLYRDYPDLPEGRLTFIRASLVNGKTLGRIGGELRLGDYLRVGKGEEQSGGRARESNLAHALEALIGAVYLDSGVRKAQGFALRLLRGELEAIDLATLQKDYKSLLQERLHALGRPTPRYRTLDAQGPSHQMRFTVEVLVEGVALAQGAGDRKKAAEMEAARNALEVLQERSSP